MFHPMRLIHISDPHLTSLEGIARQHFVGKRRLGYASWRYRRRYRHLRATLDRLCALAGVLKPDVIVVTGDLVHLGLAEEIEAAADWLRELGSPDEVFVVPGNHDVYGDDSWAAVAAHWREYLRLTHSRHQLPAADAGVSTGEREGVPLTRKGAGDGYAQSTDQGDEPSHWTGFPTLFARDGIQIHGLNSGLPTPVLRASGELGASQCERLAQSLATAPVDSMHILAVHHPPVRGIVPARKALGDLHRLEAVANKVHLVLHGHGHFNHTYRLGAVPVFATGSASKADASLRCLDIARQPSGWRVEMRLHARGRGGFSVTETQVFDFS